MPTSPPACALVAPAASPTLDAAELAELCTLERPSDALDDACAAFSFTTPVASAVVEALRMPARRTANVDCRNTARDAARDIVKSAGVVEMADGDGVVVVMSSGWHVELRYGNDFSWPERRSEYSGASGSGSVNINTSRHSNNTRITSFFNIEVSYELYHRNTLFQSHL